MYSFFFSLWVCEGLALACTPCSGVEWRSLSLKSVVKLQPQKILPIRRNAILGPDRMLEF